jgi:hypothetical protein
LYQLIEIFSSNSADILSIVAVLLIIWLINKAHNDDNQDNKNVDKKILQEVDKKKQRAKDLGLLDLITDIYMNHVKNFPELIRCNRDYVPSMVKNFIESKKRWDHTEIVIELNDKKYTFRFNERNITLPDGKNFKCGDLELFFNNEKCFALYLHCDEFEYYGYHSYSWSASEINAFKEGEWIKDFKELKKQIDKQIDVDSKIRSEKEQTDKINQLKANFDID